MLNKLIGSLVGVGLFLSLTSGTVLAQKELDVDMPVSASEQTSRFRRLEQPLGTKIVVTLGGLGLIGLELWWFLISKNKAATARASHQVHRPSGASYGRAAHTPVDGAHYSEMNSGADRAGTPPTTSPNLGGDCSRSVSVGHSFPPQNWGGVGRGGSQAAPLRGDDPLPAGDLHSAGQGVQEVEITVDGGYEPSHIVVEADQPVQLNFLRRDRSSCLETVLFPEFGIAQNLALDQVTTVELPSPKPGRYQFTCGMNMFRGVLEARVSK